MITTRSRLRRSGAGITVAALVGSGLLLAPSAQAAEKVLTELDVNLNYTRTAGSNTFLADGVQVKTVGTTSQSKAAGYFDVDTSLADAGEPSMAWSGTSPRPGTQLVVDFDGDGDEDGILVGEPIYGTNWWLPGNTLAGAPVDAAVKEAAPKVGGGGSTENGPLSAWRTAFPNAEITRAGWSLGSGIEGEGVISRISVGSDDYYFTKAAIGTETLYRSDVSPRDTRSQGRNTFRPTGGVRIFTLDASSNAKATGYFAIDEPLADVGEPAWTYTAAEGIEPGKQLVIDLDGSPETLSDRGILVGEPVYGKNWWLTNGSSAQLKAISPQTGGGNGSNWFGTLNEWRLKAPNATVLEAGWSLGSGVKADGRLDEFRVGQTVYAFAGNRAPAAAPVTGEVREGDDAVRIPLKGTDPDTDVYTDIAGGKAIADTLTYSVDGADGTATVDGDELVYTPSSVQADGTDAFSYTVTDDRGSSATSTVTIAVADNEAPAVDDLTATTTVGEQVQIELSATDPEGDDVTFTVTQPVRGSAELNQAGDTVTYTPDDDFQGQDTFTYTATDDRGASSTADVTVTVNNQAPVATDVVTTSPVGVNKTVTLPEVDADGDQLIYNVPPGGNTTATVDDNEVTIVVPKSSIAPRTVNYVVTDARGATDTGSITINPTKATTSTVVTLSPAAPKPGQSVTGNVTVSSTASVTRGIVDIYVSNKLVGTGRVTQDGKVSFALGKAVKGTRTIYAKFRGTSLTTGSQSPNVRIINK